jgi:hypothetical protein
MPPRKQKQKQKQRQKQQQTVVVNIQEKKAKKRRAHRKKADQSPLPPPVVLGLPKVPPIVVQYSEPASLQPAPPVQQPVPASIPQPAATSTMFEQPVAKAFEQPVKVPLTERAVAPERKRPARIPPPPSPTGSAISATSFADYMNPRFITPAPLRVDVPQPFADIIGQPSGQETLAESLPMQMASGGGGIPTRRPRGPYATRQYPNKGTIIKQLVEKEGYYNVEDLTKMDKNELRYLYDTIIKK